MVHAAFPQLDRFSLDNGLTVLAAPHEELPLIHVSAVLRTGYGCDPMAWPGLVGFLGEVLAVATNERIAASRAEEDEPWAGTVTAHVDADGLSIAVGVAPTDLGPALSALAETLRAPQLKFTHIEQVRAQRLARLDPKLSEAGSVAVRRLRRLVFSVHPYASNPLGEQEVVEMIGQNVLMRLAHDRLTPANTAVVVMGPVDAGEIRNRIVQRFGAWRGRPGSVCRTDQAKAVTPRLLILDRPGADLAHVHLGHMVPESCRSNDAALLVTNTMLGSMSSSLLGTTLAGEREQAVSTLELMRWGGALLVRALVPASKAVEVTEAILAQARLLRAGILAYDHLQEAKRVCATWLQQRLQHQDSLAAAVAELFLFDLPLDYHARLFDKILAVTPGELRRAAGACLDPDQASVVLVGDEPTLTAALVALGKHELSAPSTSPGTP